MKLSSFYFGIPIILSEDNAPGLIMAQGGLWHVQGFTFGHFTELSEAHPRRPILTMELLSFVRNLSKMLHYSCMGTHWVT